MLAELQFWKEVVTKTEAAIKKGVKEDSLKLAILEQLRDIPNIRKIRDKVEEIEEIINTDNTEAIAWDAMSIVNAIVLMINNNKEAWNSEVEEN